MGLHSSITGSPSPSGPSPRKRWFAAWLLAGWGAFWLSAVIAPCCDILVAGAQAGQESSAVEYRVQGPIGDEPRELPCPDLGHAQPASSASAVAPINTPAKAVNPPPLLAALRLFPAVAPVKPRIDAPRPPAPYHQRTARLLI
jgi:hypothetical protein